MLETRTISATQAIDILVERAEFALIDVRSEGEFERSGVPGFQNIPILSDQERHQVGLEYARSGQEAAIGLGHRLVAPRKEKLQSLWANAVNQSKQKKGIVICWRGGLRSKISAKWMAEAGLEVFRVDGGYKNIRTRLLSMLDSPPDVKVVTGLTGTGKTRLLQTTRHPTIDLEGLSNHRGSSFGLDLNQRQPSQTRFENALSLQLAIKRKTPALEDESRTIGKITLPRKLADQMKAAPLIVVESPLEERIRNIHEDYVLSPLSRGFSIKQVETHLLTAAQRLSKKMGGLKVNEISHSIRIALDSPKDLELQFSWIEPLLKNYYDPPYTRSIKKREKLICFKGSFQSCLRYLDETSIY